MVQFLKVSVKDKRILKINYSWPELFNFKKTCNADTEKEGLVWDRVNIYF